MALGVLPYLLTHLIIRNYKNFAERARFELAVEFNPYGGLANRWFQPLTHLSKAENLKAKDNI